MTPAASPVRTKPSSVPRDGFAEPLGARPRSEEEETGTRTGGSRRLVSVTASRAPLGSVKLGNLAVVANGDPVAL